MKTAATTIYRVQRFRRRGRRLIAWECTEHGSERTARQALQAAAAGNAGALAYAVTGYPDWDCWSEPRLLARLGDAPGSGAPDAPSEVVVESVGERAGWGRRLVRRAL